MTYDANVPNSGQAPSLFPAQGATNFVRLKALVGADHKFNDTVAADDGYHVVTKWLNQSDPWGHANPAVVNLSLETYTKTYNTLGVNTQVLMFKSKDVTSGATIEGTITGWPVRAAAVFQYNAGLTQESGFNGTITRTAQGFYTLTFAVALPTNKYSVSIVGSRSSGNAVMCGQVDPGVFGTNQTTTFVKFHFLNSSDQKVDPAYASIVVMGG